MRRTHTSKKVMMMLHFDYCLKKVSQLSQQPHLISYFSYHTFSKSAAHPIVAIPAKPPNYLHPEDTVNLSLTLTLQFIADVLAIAQQNHLDIDCPKLSNPRRYWTI